ncbi:DUF932 domain-containing protein [Myxosarcina sp. GI1]|uniref:DUF932 domain-containing protein n=1 Tax=Myxosarcina sp. GI1 TaxID=1541065 RepID=UPI00055AC745|nr:DUF932 domain-containing protein [Myxosarcina sp. GI1]
MKSGKSLVELAQELERQSEAKKDYVAETTALKLKEDSSLVLEGEDAEETLKVTPHTHGQIASRVNIPLKYYKRMLFQQPELLATNVNTWFNEQPERRMIRTLDGTARAYLSDRYRRLDNYELAETILPILTEMGEGMKILSTEITETRMYLKVVNRRLEAEVSKGDVVQAGIAISNSEIGLGSLRVEPLIYRLVCTNGCILQDYSTKKYHVGKRVESEADVYQLYADDTLKADDKAFFLKVRDTVRAAIDQTKFETIVNKMRDAKERKIEGSPVKAVEVLANKFTYNQDEQSGILTHLIQGGDLSAYGLMNAVTRTSQDLADYDRATEFERDGDRVLNLAPATWKQLATVK